ncbi:extracellular catalytic domain type 1 short-chain-length polyhydroxyalkanoate depolymerase [Pseudonocardia sp. HH130630-07]|uniref:extracellular catalytic domain type 1 short-chain-length polyhydroxyalkanoate depolymerase n=1 Tax=Pseudonocardia sp. HH130630-07 TaxID=1690815 RepID=UPI000AAF5A0C|nr:PHB depolymerase family esterase [Pseudonocardia sp. HH130630-07]
MPDRRSIGRLTAWFAAALAPLVLAAVPAAAAPEPEPAAGRDVRGSYSSSQGTVDYQVHLPASWRPDRPMPVVMAVHGCGMTGYGLNSMKSLTRFDDLADREGFVVVYPTQSLLRNLKLCWNSLSPEHQDRGRGEPELLAGTIRQVVDEFGADPARVHVAGASSGAGAAVILGATYPDLVATVTSVAGGEYGFHTAQDRLDTVSPADTARLALAAMGPRARQVPLLVVQGDQDEVVPPVMAQRLVQQWLVLGELITTGGTEVDPAADDVERVEPAAGHPYTRSSFRRGATAIDSYLIEGQGHAWSGPEAGGLFADREGPDLSEIVWRFASTRPLGAVGP